MAQIARVLNPSRKRVENPHIFFVNGGKMKTATRRSGRRPNKTHSSSTRRKPNAKSHSRAMTHHRRRPNPFNKVQHIRRRRRKNPVAFKGMFAAMLPIAGGVILTDVATNFVGNMINQFAPGLLGGQWGQIGLRLLTSWLLGWGAQSFTSTQTATLIAAGGAAGAVQDVVRVLLSQVGGAIAPTQPVITPAPAAPPQLGPPGQGMSDITYAPDGYGTLGDVGYAPAAGGW